MFKPVFHTMMLIWKHSKYYAQPSRVLTLVQEMCNALIEKAMVAGEGMHQKEPQEVMDTLRMIVYVLSAFKKTYLEYKARLEGEAPQRRWSVPNSSVFVRLDAFLQRAADVMDINQTCLQFSKLGGDRGVEIGGTKGTQSGSHVFVIVQTCLLRHAPG
jgi:dynein heavy chain, axonemal